MTDDVEGRNSAHGGELVNLIVHERKAKALKELSLDLESITLSQCAVCDLELLMNGGFSPLAGFMNQSDYGHRCWTGCA
jgi:sulfate adenylyltransferase